MSKQTEMEEIYDSYEWLIREKLEQLDWLARKMYSEMGMFSISTKIAEPYVKKRMTKLIADVIQKGAEEYGKKEGKFRHREKKHSRFNQNL